MTDPRRVDLMEWQVPVAQFYQSWDSAATLDVEIFLTYYRSELHRDRSMAHDRIMAPCKIIVVDALRRCKRLPFNNKGGKALISVPLKGQGSSMTLAADTPEEATAAVRAINQMLDAAVTADMCEPRKSAPPSDGLLSRAGTPVCRPSSSPKCSQSPLHNPVLGPSG